MKNTLLICVFIFFSLSLFSQFDSDSYYLSFGVGAIPSFSQQVDLLGLGEETSLRPITAAFELPLNSYWDSNIADHFLVGVILGYSTNKTTIDFGVGDEEFRTTLISVLFRANFTLTQKNSLTPYIGAQFGSSNYRASFDSSVNNQPLFGYGGSVNLNASGFYAGLRIGDLDSSLTGFVEFGTSIALVSAGLMFAI